MLSLSDKQLSKLSDIASDTALVSLASVALPAIFNKFNTILIIIGFSLTLFLWLMSLWLLKDKSLC